MVNDDEKTAAAAAAAMAMATLQEASDATEPEASHLEVGTDLEAAALEDVPVDLPRDAEDSTTNNDDDGGNFEISSTLSSSDAAHVEVQLDNDEDRSGNDEGALVYGSTESNENFHPTAQAVYPEVVANHRIQQEVAERKKNIAVAEMVETDEEAQVPHSDESSNQKNCFVSLCNTRKRKIIIFNLTLTIAIVAVVIGVTVGNINNNNNNNNSRENVVQQWLQTNGVSSLEDMAEPGSPQNLALSWIAVPDKLPQTLDSPEGARFVSRYVAALLYYALDGSSWDYQLSFLSEQDVCEWNDIIVAAEGVQGQFLRIGLSCDNGIVNTWQMPGINMQGTIPTEISYLSNLRFIAINDNKIQGTIPQGFQKMMDLDYLALQQNLFVGSMPDWMGDLSNVRVLGLGGNDLDGTLPNSLGKMTQLITLGLDDNKFTEKITSQLQNLTSLRRLYVDGNVFVDNLDIVFDEMVELEELDASSNRLNGNVPLKLLQSSTLRILDLHDNELDGPIPSNITSNPVLNYLALHDNLLTGGIPSSIANMNNLAHLDLSSNVLGGDIPARLGELTHLKYLFIGSNALTPGPIPTWIGNFQSLKDLSLRETGRFDAIATEIGSLKNLRLLDLHNNGLTGPLPQQLGELPNLRFLLLGRNQLTGTVPADFELLTSLEVLMLNDNSFTGSVDGICTKGITPSVFMADCIAEVTCSCCTTCCVDTDEACNERNSIVALDPPWENSFERQFYEFGSE